MTKRLLLLLILAGCGAKSVGAPKGSMGEAMFYSNWPTAAIRYCAYHPNAGFLYSDSPDDPYFITEYKCDGKWTPRHE